METGLPPYLRKRRKEGRAISGIVWSGVGARLGLGGLAQRLGCMGGEEIWFFFFPPATEAMTRRVSRKGVVLEMFAPFLSDCEQKPGAQ